MSSPNGPPDPLPHPPPGGPHTPTNPDQVANDIALLEAENLALEAEILSTGQRNTLRDKNVELKLEVEALRQKWDNIDDEASEPEPPTP